MTLRLDAHLPLLISEDIGGGRAGVVARRDGTFLVAYSGTLWHVAAEGAVLAEATIPSGATYLAPTAGTADLLIVDGVIHRIDAGMGITVTGIDSGLPPPEVNEHNVSPFLHGERTVIVTRTSIHFYSAAGVPVVTWPSTGPTVYPQAAFPSGDTITLLALDGTVWSATAGGATQIEAVALPAANSSLGGTNPSATPSVTLTGGPHWGAHLISDGAVVATDGQDDLDRIALGMTAPTARGGVTVTQWTNFDYSHGGYPPAFDLVHYYTPGGELHTARLAPGKMTGAIATGPTLSHHESRVAVVDVFVDDNEFRNLHLWLLTIEGRQARLKVGVIQDGHQAWRLIGDESWAHGPGRLKLGVPTSVSPSGWVMEVKPGDDTSQARWIKLGAADGGMVHAARFVPAPPPRG